MRHEKPPLATLLVVVMIGFASPSPAEEYLTHARLSYDAGGTVVRGLSDADWSNATINTMILPGDTLWVDHGGTAEVEFPGGSFLRLADGSKVEIASLPPDGSLRGWQGSFYVQRLYGDRGNLVFASPACSVEIAGDSTLRVDVIGEGATTVSVRRGRATVRTDAGGDIAVSEGYRIWVDPGLLPSSPVPYDRSAEDTFDTWNRERMTLLAGGPNSLPKTVIVDQQVMGVSDLGNYGEWVYVDNSYCWRPTVVANYVPYRYGSWNYVPRCGSVWVGSYPFSYVTSHYGRWRHHGTHGWLWSYHSAWSPAWAATVRCGDYFVWAPVDYYGYPVVTGGAYFSMGGVHFGYGCTSYVPVSYCHYGPNYVYGINQGISHYIGRHPQHLSVWNINHRRPPHVAVPYDNSIGRHRDYNPRRAIRGPVYTNGSSRTARARAHQLESGLGRTRFSSATRSGARGSATHIPSGQRQARVRSVRVSSTAAQARQPLPRTHTTSRGAAANPARATRSSGNQSLRIPSRTTANRDMTAARSNRSTRSTTATSNRRSETLPSRTWRQPQSSASTSARTAPTRTPVPGESGRTVSSGRRTTAHRAPTRATRSTALTPPRVETSARRQVISTETPSSGPRNCRTSRSNPARTRTVTPTNRTVTRAPSPGANSRSPRTTAAPATTATRTTRSGGPAPTTVTRSAPPARSSAPSINRSAPRSRSSAPSVSRSAPSARSSAPSVSRSAPTSRSSSSVSRSSGRASSGGRSSAGSGGRSRGRR